MPLSKALRSRNTAKNAKNKDLASKDSVLSKLDEILVGIGKYPGKKELMEDAFRALLRAKPELKMDLAVELYKKKEISLSKGAEISGLNVEDFKELLRERGIKISIPALPSEDIDKEVERILRQ
ncbi:MAG TPA: hypothetical protein GXX52_10165 [Synergistaceae bacterium]|nr:hypothetical protein [Synergistaceae bacterium]